MKEITSPSLFVPLLFPPCGANWAIVRSSVSEQTGARDREHPRLLLSRHCRTNWESPSRCAPQSVPTASIAPGAVSVAWGANEKISSIQAVLPLCLARKQVCYSLKSHRVIIWSRLKSQSLGSELGQYSSSTYLDSTARRNQSGSEQTAAYLRIGEYKKYYHFKKSKRRKLPAVDHSLKLMDSPAPPLPFADWKLRISRQTNSVLSGTQLPMCLFFCFTQTTAKNPQFPSRSASCLNEQWCWCVRNCVLWFYHTFWQHLPHTDTLCSRGKAQTSASACATPAAGKQLRCPERGQACSASTYSLMPLIQHRSSEGQTCFPTHRLPCGCLIVFTL